MNFLHPEFLYYMLPPLFILFGFLLTQKEAQANFFSDEVMRKLRVSGNTLTLKARNAIFFLIGFLMIIALAGPVINEGTVEVKAKSADIMMALDISDSMLAEDVYPNRLESAKQKAMELLKIAPNERIGIVAFAKNSYLVSPLSFDHGAVSFLLRQLNTDSITEKGTDFLSLLEVTNNSIKNDAKKYLLIFSDGGDKEDFSKEIEYAKEKNIVVFILGIASEKGAPIKLKDGSFIKQNGDIIISKLNENITDLATKSGGVYIQSVRSDEDIKTMLREIESKSEEKELKSEEVQKFIPLFYFPLGLALLLLLVATSSMSKRETVQVPSIFLLFALLFSVENAKAGLLDFMELDKAKKAYEAGKFEESQKIYSEYADKTKSADSFYNAANSLYKQGKFKEAIESYERAAFEDSENRAKKYANIGNSYVKAAEQDGLKKAKEYYEKSLKLKEDKQTRENLEAVEKAIEEQKKQEQNQQDQEQNKDKQENQDKNQEQNKENNKEQNQDQKNKENNETNQQESQDNEQKSDKDEDKKDSDKQNQEDEQKQDSEQSQDKEGEEESEDKNETKQEQKSDELQELDKNEDNSSKSSDAMQQASMANDEMSDAEEKKWLDQLNKQQNSYMYRLNNQKPKEEDPNEKPW